MKIKKKLKKEHLEKKQRNLRLINLDIYVTKFQITKRMNHHLLK